MEFCFKIFLHFHSVLSFVMSFVLLTFICLLSASVSIPESELSGLSAFYNALGGENWKVSNWFENSNPCLWNGIECDTIGGSEHVMSISMSDNNLSGMIPETISQDFPYLISLDMPSNNVYGPIPSLPLHTYAISFRYNNVTSLPMNLCDLKSLRFSHLDFNEISDVLPQCFGDLSLLEVFGATSNKLRGTLPQSVGNLSNLETLMLGGNMIEGFVPPALLNLPKLQTLDLTGNPVGGNLDELGLMLKELDMGQTGIGGSLNQLTSAQLIHDLLYLDVSGSGVYGDINNFIPFVKENNTFSELRLLAMDISHVTGIRPLPSSTVLRSEGSKMQLMTTQGCPLFCGTETGGQTDQDNNRCLYIHPLSYSTSMGVEKPFTRLEVVMVGDLKSCDVGYVGMMKVEGLECAHINTKDIRYKAKYYGNSIQGSIVCDDVVFEHIDVVCFFVNDVEVGRKPQHTTQTETQHILDIDISENTSTRPRADGDSMVKVVVTGMSKCPDFSAFMMDILQPSSSGIEALNTQYSSVDEVAVGVNVSFIVEPMNEYVTGVWSMHGQVEVIGDSAFECADKIGGFDMVLRLSECLFGNAHGGIDNIPSNVEDCFVEITENIRRETGVNYDPDELSLCAYSTGFNLVVDGNSEAKRLGAIWSPTIYLNDKMICKYRAPGKDACSFEDAQGFLDLVSQALDDIINL